MNESISVSAFLAILNETLSFAYPEVTIQGEVSEYRLYQNKFVYLTLKDEESVLRCFMMAYVQKLPVEVGMTVRVVGTPRVYQKRGDLSFNVKAIELAGEGELKRAFELLKAKLELEGLFDLHRKRALPAYPGRIGLITSVGSAAYHDFIKILVSRWGGLDVIVADAVVQGLTAPDSVVGAMAHLNQLAEPLDVIALVRGGGSLEDLAAFNTEPVVRAIAASRTPVIAGVGHEIDISLADLAADVRAATPTDAARLVVPDRAKVLAAVEHLGAAMSLRLERNLSSATHRCHQAEVRLERFIDRPRQLIDQSLLQLQQAIKTQVTKRQDHLEALARLLRGFDPTATLRRGYAIVRRGETVLRDSAAAQTGDRLMIQLAQGKLGATVDGK